MADQHVRAFQLRRNEFGDEINQWLANKIASHMGNDGSPAELAIKTLASAVPCHYNTADKRLKEMAAMGLIKMSKGGGKLFKYSIPGEYEDGITGPYVPPAVDHSDEIEAINKRLDNLEVHVKMLVKMVAGLSHDLHTIVTSSSHDLHMNFTPPVNEDVNKEEKKRRREEEKEEDIYISTDEKIHLRELPPEALPDYEYQERLEEMAQAINSQVRDFYGVATNEKKFKNAADAMMLKEAAIEKVKGFDAWWQENGWYKSNGKASLQHFLDHWDDYINGVCLRQAATNGHQVQEEFTADAIKKRLREKQANAVA